MAFGNYSKVLFSQQSAFNDIGFAKCKEVFSTTNQGQVWIITPVYILFWKEWKLGAFFDLRLFFLQTVQVYLAQMQCQFQKWFFMNHDQDPYFQ